MNSIFVLPTHPLPSKENEKKKKKVFGNFYFLNSFSAFEVW